MDSETADAVDSATAETDARVRELEAEVARLRADLDATQADEAEWRALVETLPQIVWITRPDGWHVHFNRQWCEFTGLTLEESIGDGWAPPFHPDDRPLAWKLWKEATATGRPYEVEYRLRRHDGRYHWMLGRALPLHDRDGEIVKWFGTCTDIEELKAAEARTAELLVELERRADHDPLTGLANRDLLFRQMDLLLRQRRRVGVAAAFVDLDGFKAVNDRCGHDAGDKLLVRVADQLRDAVRQGDVAARIGGDEFVVVGETDDEHDADRFAERLRAALGASCKDGAEEVPVTASVGVVYVAPGDRASSDEVLSSADARMYRQKRDRYAGIEPANP